LFAASNKNIKKRSEVNLYCTY